MNIYKREDLKDLQQITQAKLTLLNIEEKLGIHKNKNKWKSKDSKFIVDNWGKMPVTQIAENLNKSYVSVICHADNLGLKNALLYSDYVSVYELVCGFQGSSINYTWTTYLMSQHNAPIEYKIFYNAKNQAYIKLNNFYEWYKQNIHIVDLNNANMDFFTNAPSWFVEKYEADKIAHEFLIKRKWTDEEDTKLKAMIEQGKSYKEISLALKRTGGALKRRFTDLQIAERPIKADNHIKWTEDEKEKVKTLWLKGYKPCVIMNYIDRSDLAINGFLERNKYFGVKLKFPRI